MVVAIDGPRLYAVAGQQFIHVPDHRGVELQAHLAAHGIASRLSTPALVPYDRLDLDGGADPEVVQALLDSWER